MAARRWPTEGIGALSDYVVILAIMINHRPAPACAADAGVELSGHSRLNEPDQVVGLSGSGREPIILGTQPSDLEFQCPNAGTQLRNLVDKAPVGRAAYVAEEGLGHIVSLFSAAGNSRSTRALVSRPMHTGMIGRDWRRFYSPAQGRLSQAKAA